MKSGTVPATSTAFTTDTLSLIMLMVTAGQGNAQLQHLESAVSCYRLCDTHFVHLPMITFTPRQFVRALNGGLSRYISCAPNCGRLLALTLISRHSLCNILWTFLPLLVWDCPVTPESAVLHIAALSQTTDPNLSSLASWMPDRSFAR